MSGSRDVPVEWVSGITGEADHGSSRHNSFKWNVAAGIEVWSHEFLPNLDFEERISGAPVVASVAKSL